MHSVKRIDYWNVVFNPICYSVKLGFYNLVYTLDRMYSNCTITFFRIYHKNVKIILRLFFIPILNSSWVWQIRFIIVKINKSNLLLGIIIMLPIKVWIFIEWLRVMQLVLMYWKIADFLSRSPQRGWGGSLCMLKPCTRDRYIMIHVIYIELKILSVIDTLSNRKRGRKLQIAT